MESGSSLNTWALEYHAKENAFKLGEALGIKTSDTKELVNKLKEYSVPELVTATTEVAKTMVKTLCLTIILQAVTEISDFTQTLKMGEVGSEKIKDTFNQSR